jgi:uncharacterized protein
MAASSRTARRSERTADMIGDEIYGRALSAGSIVKVGAIVYMLAALLNSSSLVTIAKNQKAGTPTRSVTRWFADRNQSISEILGTARAGEWADDWRNQSTRDEFGFDSPAASATSTTVPVSATTTAGQTPPGATTTVETIPATTVAVEPDPDDQATPTAADPMRVYIAGDSLVQDWGNAVRRIAGNDALVSAPVVDYKAATGLMRPDKYDWPRRLQDQVNSRRPDMVIVGFGGNDGQAIEVKGNPVAVGSPEWIAEYRSRVGSTMDFLTANGRTVIWVGTPMASEPGLFASQQLINQIYRDETARRPAVKFVDTWEIFASPEGAYAAYIAVDDEVKLVRREDGFHLTTVGAEFLAKQIYALVTAEARARGAAI